MAGRRVHFVFPDDLVSRIDAACDGVSRGEFVRRAVEQALSGAKEPSPRTQADPGSVPSSEGVRSAAPAERPGESLLSDAKHMEPHAAETAQALVEAWQRVPPEEFEASARSLHQPARSSSQSKRDVPPTLDQRVQIELEEVARLLEAAELVAYGLVDILEHVYAHDHRTAEALTAAKRLTGVLVQERSAAQKRAVKG